MLAMSGMDVPEAGGDLAATMVSSAGSEDMVQDFVSIHMQGLLRPFSERLQELQAQVAVLEESAASACAGLDTHERRLIAQEEAARDLQTTAEDSNARLEKALGELTSLKKEKMRLDGNHVETKASVSKAKETLASLAASVEEVRNELQESKTRLGGLETNLQESEARISEQTGARLDKQGRVCKEVNERSSEALKACQQARALGESANAAVKKLQEVSEEHRKHDVGNMENLSQQVADLQAKLLEVDALVVKHDDGIKTADREVQHLRAWTDQLKQLQDLQSQTQDMGATVSEHIQRLDRAEEHICQLQSGSCASRLQDSELHDLKQAWTTTTNEVKQLANWRQAFKLQGDTLNSAACRMDDMEGESAKIASRTGNLEQQLEGLLAWRQTAAQSLQDHQKSLQEANGSLRQAHEGVAQSKRHCTDLQSELGAQHEVVQKLGGRVEMCCRYFNGLGKGLQDAHRQVNAGDAPKSGGGGGGTALPALPRTPRVAVPSPRRVRSLERAA